jgi:cyanate lyase
MTENITDPTLPLHQLIEARQRALNLSDEEFSQALGFDSTTPLTMIKAGHMMLPIAKVAVVAQCLDLPADQLLLRHLTERAPEVLKALQDCRVWTAS